MNAIIVYDSMYGNTEQIARAIGHALGSLENVGIIRVGDVKPEQLTGLTLLIVGSPTQGGRPTPAIQDFLNRIPEHVLRDIRVATFDTRLPGRLVGLFGYAAGRIADSLKRKGAMLIASPAGFFVRGREGPLKEGELERAAVWARQLIATSPHPSSPQSPPSPPA